MGDCPVNCYNYKWRGFLDMVNEQKKKALVLGITGQDA